MFERRKPTIAELSALHGRWRQHPRYWGCKAHWYMHEGAGQTIYDISGSGADGTLVNMTPAVAWNRPVVTGPALHFGETNNNVTTAFAPHDMAGDTAISVWILLDSVIDIAGMLLDTNTMYIYDRGTHIRIAHGDLQTQARSATNLSLGTLQHVVVNIPANGIGLDFYIDGVLSNDGSNPSLGAPIPAASEFMIGNRPGFDRPFDGIIDDFRIYNRLLSPAEAVSLFQEPNLEVDDAYRLRARRYFFAPVSLSDIVPPDNFAAVTGQELGQIDLSWDVAAGAINYHLYRGLTELGAYEKIAITSELFYTDEELDDSTTYWYKIASEDEDGIGVQSSPVSAMTLIVPDTPQNLAVTQGSFFGELGLDWDDVQDADSYGIYRATQSGGPYTLIDTVAVSTYSDTGLEGPVEYFYVVTAITSLIESQPSAEDSATTLGPGASAPRPPANVQATPGNNEIVLTWDQGAGDVINYIIYRSFSSGTDYEEVGQSGEPAFTDTGLTSGVTHFYVITADNLNFESAFSAEVSAVPLSLVLDAEQGGYAITMQDVVHNLGQGADQGTYAVTGQDSDLTFETAQAADQGTYSITGQDAEFQQAYGLLADQGTYSITGQDAELVFLPGEFLGAETGFFTITGQDAAQTLQTTMAADQGTHTVTSQDTSLTLETTMPASRGFFQQTGNVAILVISAGQVAEQGTYAVTGQDAELEQAIGLPAEQGTYTITGPDVQLIHSGGEFLDAATGFYIITGQDATLALGGETLEAEQGAYAVTGQDATLTPVYSTDAEQGLYEVTVGEAVPFLGTTVEAEQGTYTVTGEDTTLEETLTLPAQRGVYVMNFQQVTNLINGEPDVGGGGIIMFLRRRRT